MNTIRVGTRGSQLALIQTTGIARALESAHQGIRVDIVTIKTTGDLRRDVPFTEVGTKGMFVKEIEEALLGGTIDFAVHSLKDMPGELAPGLVLAATPRREDPRDALLSNKGTLNQLPPRARVGTSSARRQAALREIRPDLELAELRGNLDTRIRKLDDGDYDAIVLACAGLERMGLGHRITERIRIEVSVPAPGQGALALECRESDVAILSLLAVLNNSDAVDEVNAERAFQLELGAGCTVPAGCCAHVNGQTIEIHAMAEGGHRMLKRVSLTGLRSEGANLGRECARRLKPNNPAT